MGAFADCSWEEGNIDFPPTYKLNESSSLLSDYDQKRAPGWCDRILWRRNPSLPVYVDISLLGYGSVRAPYSDHAPVWASFVLEGVATVNGSPRSHSCFSPVSGPAHAFTRSNGSTASKVP